MTRDGKAGRGDRKSTSRAKRESSAGGVVYRVADRQSLFLLIQDSYGNWGFPKGHLERGEAADTAALREVMEETGLRSVSVVGPIDSIEWFFRFRDTLIRKNCQFFLMETTSATTKPQQAEGIAACKWATVAEAQELIRYDNARDILLRASEMVSSRETAQAGRTP